MSSLEAPNIAVDGYQLIQPPLQLDPRILVALARLVMEGQVAVQPHTAALMALTVAAWTADHFLVDKAVPTPAPVPGPIAASPGANQPEAGTLLHAAACLANSSHPLEGLPLGVQGALPPVDWAKVIQVVVVILQQVAPLFEGGAP